MAPGIRWIILQRIDAYTWECGLQKFKSYFFITFFKKELCRKKRSLSVEKMDRWLRTYVILTKELYLPLRPHNNSNSWWPYNVFCFSVQCPYAHTDIKIAIRNYHIKILQTDMEGKWKWISKELLWFITSEHDQNILYEIL